MQIMERSGIINSFVEASLKGAKIKIICPINRENSHIINRILKQANSISIMDAHHNLPSIILIVDSCRFLQAEQKDSHTLEISKSIGFAIYSNSKRNVTSFKSFFKLLWDQYTVNNNLKNHEILQREFINIVAHELRTPITPIIGLTEYVRDKLKDKEQIDLLNIVINDTRQLQNLSENILDITRIEGKIFELKRVNFNLNQLILDITGHFEKDTETKIKKVRFNYSNNLKSDYILYTDKYRIGKVLSNLISNSVKFISDDGIISVNVEEKRIHHKEMVVVSVKDNGDGINPDIRSRLFTKFVSKSFYGTGLGLYICKNIIEAHGGSIWTENNKDDKGAIFRFSIPLKD